MDYFTRATALGPKPHLFTQILILCHEISKFKQHVIFYISLQIAKVSKLLLEMERGTVHNYKGKSLDEIQFDLNGMNSLHFFKNLTLQLDRYGSTIS